MKLAFWSSQKGQGNVTSNMIALSTVIASQYDYKMILMQTQYKDNNLWAPFYRLKSHFQLDEFGDTGVDALVRLIKTEPLSPAILHNCSVSILEDKLCLLPETTKLNQSLYEDQITNMIGYILKNMDVSYDITMVDTIYGTNTITDLVLSESDYIIVCVSQNIYQLNSLFQRMELPSHKIFYLFGNYEEDSKYNIKYLRKKYSISAKQSAIIPKNVRFMDAINDGDVLKFFNRNKGVTKEECDYRFFKEVEKAAQKLLKFIELKKRGAVI